MRSLFRYPRLDVTWTIHDSPRATSEHVIALQHGICHSRAHFLPLIEQLNALGHHVAMIDQQSENAGFWRNLIGLDQYVDGMADAVQQIEARRPIGCYALHSMGAMVGEEMQQRNPKLRRPSLLMTPIPVDGALPNTWRLMREYPIAYLRALLTLDILSLARQRNLVRELFFDDATPDEIVEATRAKLKHAPFWAYCQLVFRPFTRSRIRPDELPPMRILYGERDGIFRVEEYESMLARYVDVEVEPIPDVHDFFVVDPKGAAERIAGFYRLHRPHAQLAGPHVSFGDDESKS